MNRGRSGRSMPGRKTKPVPCSPILQGSVFPDGPAASGGTNGQDQASLRRLMTLLEIYADGKRMDPQPAELMPMSVICRRIGVRVPASRCLSDLAALSLGIVASVSEDS